MLQFFRLLSRIFHGLEEQLAQLFHEGPPSCEENSIEKQQIITWNISCFSPFPRRFRFHLEKIEELCLQTYFVANLFCIKKVMVTKTFTTFLQQTYSKTLLSKNSRCFSYKFIQFPLEKLTVLATYSGTVLKYLCMFSSVVKCFFSVLNIGERNSNFSTNLEKTFECVTERLSKIFHCMMQHRFVTKRIRKSVEYDEIRVTLQSLCEKSLLIYQTCCVNSRILIGLGIF